MLSTLHCMITLAMQHSMVRVGTGTMPSNAKAATRNDINFVASSSGLMAATPSDARPSTMVVAGDIATARKYGDRLADTVKRLAR
jgi:NAD(P)H dehydrogenase (quinone)